MRELDIDISRHRSKSVDEFTGQSFDYVLTVYDNARDSWPVFPGKTITVHTSFENPADLRGTDEERLAEFRRVRDEHSETLRISARPGASLVRDFLNTVSYPNQPRYVIERLTRRT